MEVRVPTVRLPMVVDAKLASVDEAEIEEMAFGKMTLLGNESVHVLSADRS